LGCAEQFLQNNDLIGDLPKLVRELAVVDSRVDFEAKLVQGGLGRFLQFGVESPKTPALSVG